METKMVVNTKIAIVMISLLLVFILDTQTYAVTDVQHTINGSVVTLTYNGTPPYYIKIRADPNIEESGGYVWTKTSSNSFTIDLGYAKNPTLKFYYAVKDTSWSDVESFILGEHCSDGTPPNHCSTDQPLLCFNGALIEDCQNCGCTDGLQCVANGSCVESFCTIITNNGDPEDKLDITFVGDDYSDMTVFIDDVNVFINGLLSYEPFNSERNKINFYRVDNVADLGCEYNCGPQRLICCDYSKIEQVTVHCPSDQTIVIVNSDEYGGAGGYYPVSFRGDYRVFVHEFGHGFGDLLDEYSYGGISGSAPNGPNCAANNTCSKWADL